MLPSIDPSFRQVGKVVHDSHILIEDILLYSANVYILIRYLSVLLVSLWNIDPPSSLASTSILVDAINIWIVILTHEVTTPPNLNVTYL